MATKNNLPRLLIIFDYEIIENFSIKNVEKSTFKFGFSIKREIQKNSLSSLWEEKLRFKYFLKLTKFIFFYCLLRQILLISLNLMQSKRAGLHYLELLRLSSKNAMSCLIPDRHFIRLKSIVKGWIDLKAVAFVNR